MGERFDRVGEELAATKTELEARDAEIWKRPGSRA